MESATVALPRPAGGDDYQGQSLCLGTRRVRTLSAPCSGRFPTTICERNGKIDLVATDTIIRQLFEGLRVAGLVEIVLEPQ